MSDHSLAAETEHSHFFLGASSATNERKTWIVVGLTSVMMVIEIIGGSVFHSIALVADGIHMSTHAGVMLLAALAYRYARNHAADRRFAMGTGKLGDLAAFTSAIILAMFSILIGYEAFSRFFSPERIDYAAAIPIAVLGLLVNAVSAFVLAGDHDHSHGHHGHDHHDHDHHGHDDHHDHDHHHDHHHDHDHDHAPAGLKPSETIHRDFNMRAAYIHVLADSAVSGLVIIGLLAAKFLGWVWMDPVMGLVGAAVVANWAFGLVRAAGGILLDMTPDAAIPNRIRSALEQNGDQVSDLHVWRVGPGHLAAIIALRSANPASPSTYRRKLSEVSGLSHVTIEVEPV